MEVLNYHHQDSIGKVYSPAPYEKLVRISSNASVNSNSNINNNNNSSSTTTTTTTTTQTPKDRKSSPLISKDGVSPIKSPSKPLTTRKDSLPPKFSTTPNVIKHQQSSRHRRHTNAANHVYPIHTSPTPSLLTYETTENVSLKGFKTLAFLVLGANNLRLVIENHMKYGFLISIPRISKSTNLAWAAFLLSSMPVFIALGYLIEAVSAGYAKKRRDGEKKSEAPDKMVSDKVVPSKKQHWNLIVFLHLLNVSACFMLTTWVVYTKIFQPGLGMLSELHVIIVTLKLISFALTNRDLRDAYLNGEGQPGYYTPSSYPNNVTLSNILYFWCAPTLIYQPVYPRSPKFRKSFFLRRCLDTFLLICGIYAISVQYALPILKNSRAVDFGMMSLPLLIERTMKLSTVSVVVWLAGFFCVFQSGLNALAEATTFGDREFYQDWWNSGSIATYWKTWNRPMYNYFKRHIYLPMTRRGWSNWIASLTVFFVSAVLHEVVVAIPCHSITLITFAGMMAQIPLIWATGMLEKYLGRTTIGNCIFWLSFCLIGQPFAVLITYVMYQKNLQGVNV